MLAIELLFMREVFLMTQLSIIRFHSLDERPIKNKILECFGQFESQQSTTKACVWPRGWNQKYN